MRYDLLIGLQKFCRPIILLSFFILLINCTHQKHSAPEKISIVWIDNRATGLSISGHQILGIPVDSLRLLVQVRLASPTSETPISGDYDVSNDELVFRPLIPFTRGLRYAVYARGKLLGEIEITQATEEPELIVMYPSTDTVPENLLKIYLVFDRPMVEGHALRYVSLVDKKGDTLRNVFLELHPELWNQDGTILTLWLDPGRIKRDLQPNKLLGPPLVNGQQYQIVVSDKWPGIRGTTLRKPYAKNLVVSVRDTLSPAPKGWIFIPPHEGTSEPLAINFGESLDYMLLQNCITLTDSLGNAVRGTIQVSNQEKNFKFIPLKPWMRGLYKIRIESKLEDLSGNNLSRPFDRDLTKNAGETASNKFVELEWRVDE